MTKAKRNSKRRMGRSSAKSRSSRKDAIAVLKADHRELEGWFAQFKKTRSTERKQNLATRICTALKVHTTIEEEIFYPAFLEATEDKDLHHEAEVEHAGAKKLVEEIEKCDPDDEYFDAKVTVLSEMIKHHVKEDEQPGGMFAEARSSDMDLDALGARLLDRKMELMGNRGSRSAQSIQPIAAY